MNEAIKQYLMEHRIVSVAEAQYLTGLGYKAVREVFAEMVKKGTLSPIDDLRYEQTAPSEEKQEKEREERKEILEHARHILKQKTMSYCDVILCCLKHQTDTVGKIREYCDYRSSTIYSIMGWMKENKLMDVDGTYLLTEAETMYLLGVTDDLPEG